MRVSDCGQTSVRIIACGVFQPALEHLSLEKRYPCLRLTYLASNLHLKPLELKERLQLEFDAAKARGERVICLYGECFPGISEVCEGYGVLKMPGHHCHQMLLGPEQFDQVIDETAGTYFLEQELILNFDEYCMGPLELDDDEMRHLYFDHYRRLLYVRQPGDVDLMPKADQVAFFLGLPCEVRDVDYQYLEEKVVELIEQALGRDESDSTSGDGDEQ